MKNLKKHRVNNRIVSDTVIVINKDKENLGEMSKKEAILLASNDGLDLVEVSNNAGSTVCRIIDYGKLLYTLKKQEKAKVNTTARVKIVQLGVKIGKKDLETKVNKTLKFLSTGHDVELRLLFRGREITHKELGRELLKNVIELTKDVSYIHSEDYLDKGKPGKQMRVYLKPDNKG